MNGTLFCKVRAKQFSSIAEAGFTARIYAINGKRQPAINDQRLGWGYPSLARASTAWFNTCVTTSLGMPWQSRRFIPEAISMYAMRSTWSCWPSARCISGGKRWSGEAGSITQTLPEGKLQVTRTGVLVSRPPSPGWVANISDQLGLDLAVASQRFNTLVKYSGISRNIRPMPCLASRKATVAGVSRNSVSV